LVPARGKPPSAYAESTKYLKQPQPREPSSTVFSQSILATVKLQQNPTHPAREGFPKKQHTKRELDREIPRDAGPEQLYEDLKELDTKDAPYDWYGHGRSSK